MMLFLLSLDTLACNSANKQYFQNPTSLNVQKLQIFAICASYLASIVKTDLYGAENYRFERQEKDRMLYSLLDIELNFLKMAQNKYETYLKLQLIISCEF